MKKHLSKDYLIFALIATAFMTVAAVIFIFTSFKSAQNENAKKLQNSAKNIASIISESFDYTNQINNHIGQQIANHYKNGSGSNLKFILNLFHESELIKHRDYDLFSWSSFDWVDDKNHQIINSKLGIRNDAPNMSQRQYSQLSPQNPWTLQVSFPTFGDPSNTWVIPAATGVTNQSGKYLGAVVVGFDIAEFVRQIEQKLEKKTSFVVLDQELRIILQSTDLNLDRSSDFFSKNFHQEIFSKDFGSLSQAIEIGDIKLSHYNKLTRYPYIVLTGFDKNFLRSQFNILILPRIIEFICLTIFFLALLYLFEAKIASLLSVEKLLKAEKSLRISLEKTSRDKDKLLFSIAHDIKNYILGINGLANLTLEQKTQQQILANQDLKNVETIATHSEELMEFVKNLLDNNQIKSGQFQLGNVKNHSVKSLIQDSILINRRNAENNNVSLKTDIENDLPKILCDEYKMKQILNNLINNAIKYSRPQSEVLISAKFIKNDQKIRIEISDKGYGMNEEEVRKYLDGSGGKIDKSAIIKEKHFDSYGIGMPIVLKLVELHEGSIKVASKKNIGTTIFLEFKAAEKFNDEELDIEKNNASILLVEDNPVNIKVTSRILESSGYKVSSAENGKEALRIIDKENFDLILMDCEMPIMNGYEATKAIRSGLDFVNFKNFKSIPIIALTSCSNPITRKKVKDSGMNNHIEKAISKTDLLATIKHYLKK